RRPPALKRTIRPPVCRSGIWRYRRTPSCEYEASVGGRRYRPRTARHFRILTSVTALTRLLASTKSPSRVTEVLRTMLPPPGIAQLWNFSVLGSKRTTVFGVGPDSL